MLRAVSFAPSTIRAAAQAFAAAVSVAVLTGCAYFGAQGVPVQPMSPESLDVGREIRGAISAPAIKMRWWSVFGDPTLDQVVDDALSNSPELTAAQARVAEALALSDVERSATSPLLFATVSAAPTRFPASYKIPPPAAGHWQSDVQALLQASLDLDLSGHARALTRASERRADAQVAQARCVALALQTALVSAYLTLALDFRLLQIANDILGQREAILALTQERVAQGIDTHVAGLRASEPIPLARAEIARLNGDVARTRHQIAALVGRGPGYAETLTPRLGTLDVRPALPGTLPADLIGRRPDVAAARARVEAESAGIDAAKAAFYPSINLLAFAGLQSLGFHALFSGNSGSLGVGPAVTLPIFEGGRLRASLRAQTAAYTAAVAAYDDALIRAMEQVADSLASITALREQRELTTQALDDAQRAFDLEMRRYRRGLTGYLDVLLAQSRLFDDRSAQAQADSALLTEHVRLVAALGGSPSSGDLSK
jgi:NodT family efflux transporter outer membrane factor (OMF) lipoprotein